MDFLNNYPLPEYIKKEIKEELEKLNVDEETAKKIVERCYEVYLRNLVEPGEAAGIVTAQSIGEPGTQMSLPYEEKIIIKKGENVKIVEIGRFVDECIEKFGSIRQGIHEICDLPVDVYALSLDQDEKVHWKRITSVIRHRFSGKLIRIKTRSGRTVTATPFHSFVIRQNNRIVPIEGRKLKVGDRIPVIRNMPLNCLSAIDLTEFVGYPVLQDTIKPINGRAISRTLELDFDFGYFLGIYLADGYSTKHFVSISNTNREVIEIVRRFAERLGIQTAEYYNHSGKSHNIRLYSSVLSEFVQHFGCNAKKKIPDFVFGAEKEFVRGLLQGYFDGDGSVNVERKTIRAFSSSKELIEGIAILLTRFGIFSVKREMKGQYGIEISYRYAKKFAEEIGSSVPEKAIKLCKIAESDSEITYDLIDMISSIGPALLNISRKFRYPLHYVRKFVRKQKIGRETLRRHLARLEELAKGVEVKELEILRKAVESDVVWDEIVSIEEMDYDDYVYDLSVEGLETFTTAEGVITHNTMRTFHYAGVAEINVTLGLPRLIEILDVRKHPSTPMMTIRLLPEYAKDRNKAREIANRIEATHILDVAEIVTDLRNMRIIVKPDEKALKRKGLNKETLKKKIEKSLKTEVEETEEGLIISIKKPSYKELMDTFEKLKKLVISGIKEIKRVIVRKEGDEYVLYTEGSNLKRIMKEEGIDFTKTVTNNIYEIYEVLGIEAARNAIINEAISTLEEQGLEVDRRHIMLVADVMTADGELKQIGRHGVAGEKQSILARAAFEMTVNNLLEAAVRGEIDRLNGITENIIVGQPIKLGTGDVELVYGGSVNEGRSK
uniref:DNA-directed RNA polymerase subunit Rpo1C n=1 Tax=Geoglobus ahangari TaxID=113653 RepID=A0A7C4S6S7_9EURY